MRARVVVVVWTVVALVAVPSIASAAWLRASSGSASARATSIPAPDQPSAVVAGSSVTVSWSAVTIGGTPVAGYEVRRYAADMSVSSPGGTCAGTVTTLTCTDPSPGAEPWRYAVAARKGSWTGGESALSSAVTLATPPSVTSATVVKGAGGIDGFIRQGGTYHVYANVTAGTPSGGLSVTANVSTITAGQTGVSLLAGPWMVKGVAYGYRTAQLTADASLTAGSKNVVVTATQNALTDQRTTGVTVDNTAPTATDVQTTNGGVAGRIDAGDTLILTTSEQLEPASILAGWTGTPVVVTLQFRDNNGSDRLTIWDGANATQALGSFRLGRNDYVSADVNVAATMVQSGSTITITIGAPPASGITTAAGTGTLQWTPSATATDRAGNPLPTTAVNETGPADVDF